MSGSSIPLLRARALQLSLALLVSVGVRPVGAESTQQELARLAIFYWKLALDYVGSLSMTNAISAQTGPLDRALASIRIALRFCARSSEKSESTNINAIQKEIGSLQSRVKKILELARQAEVGTSSSGARRSRPWPVGFLGVGEDPEEALRRCRARLATLERLIGYSASASVEDPHELPELVTFQQADQAPDVAAESVVPVLASLELEVGRLVRIHSEQEAARPSSPERVATSLGRYVALKAAREYGRPIFGREMSDPLSLSSARDADRTLLEQLRLEVLKATSDGGSNLDLTGRDFSEETNILIRGSGEKCFRQNLGESLLGNLKRMPILALASIDRRLSSEHSRTQLAKAWGGLTTSRKLGKISVALLFEALAGTLTDEELALELKAAFQPVLLRPGLKATLGSLPADSRCREVMALVAANEGTLPPEIMEDLKECLNQLLPAAQAGSSLFRERMGVVTERLLQRSPTESALRLALMQLSAECAAVVAGNGVTEDELTCAREFCIRFPENEKQPLAGMETEAGLCILRRVTAPPDRPTLAALFVSWSRDEEFQSEGLSTDYHLEFDLDGALHREKALLNAEIHHQGDYFDRARRRREAILELQAILSESRRVAQSYETVGPALEDLLGMIARQSTALKNDVDYLSTSGSSGVGGTIGSSGASGLRGAVERAINANLVLFWRDLLEAASSIEAELPRALSLKFEAPHPSLRRLGWTLAQAEEKAKKYFRSRARILRDMERKEKDRGHLIAFNGETISMLEADLASLEAELQRLRQERAESSRKASCFIDVVVGSSEQRDEGNGLRGEGMVFIDLKRLGNKDEVLADRRTFRDSQETIPFAIGPDTELTDGPLGCARVNDLDNVRVTTVEVRLVPLRGVSPEQGRSEGLSFLGVGHCGVGWVKGGGEWSVEVNGAGRTVERAVRELPEMSKQVATDNPRRTGLPFAGRPAVGLWTLEAGPSVYWRLVEGQMAVAIRMHVSGEPSLTRGSKSEGLSLDWIGGKQILMRTAASSEGVLPGSSTEVSR